MIPEISFVLGLLLGLCASLIIFSKSRQKNIGEARVIAEIQRCCPQPFHLINNVTLETPGGTTQIDHILIAPFGIIVIETKCYTGWIFGDVSAKKWAQVIYRYKKSFPNPIYQNHNHVLAVKQLFNLPDGDFHNLVVFAGKGRLKTDVGGGVVYTHQLSDYFATIQDTSFDERKMAYVIGRIEMKRLNRSTETDEYHINALVAKYGARR